MPAEDLVEQRAELDGAAAHVERAHLERNDIVITGEAEIAERRSVFSQVSIPDCARGQAIGPAGAAKGPLQVLPSKPVR